ncbi:glycosyltransferase [Candidatus Ventrimonas sp. KK005]
MKQPEISVVVPVYNTSAYLEQCMESILSQTFQNMEVICVDDGSTDKSLETLERFAKRDSRITVLHRDGASGSAAVPRNMGLECARGTYVIFLDSDDYIDLQMFEKMLVCAKKQNADLVMCDNYVVSSRNGLVKDREGELHHKYITDHMKNSVFSYKDIPDTIFQISNAAVWHRMILRDVLVKHGLKFQENVPSMDDVYFVNLLMVLAERVCILDEKLVYYRELRSGGQTSRVAKHKESVCLAFDQLNQYLIENGLYDKVKISLQNWTLDILMWWYYLVQERDIQEKLFYLFKSCYLKKLRLTDMDTSKILHNEEFYHYVSYEEYRPSVNVILNSISPDGVHFVLYGAGKLGKNIYEYISNEQIHTIELWCDKNADEMNHPMIQKPEKIKDCQYDAIVIAMARDNLVLEVKQYLNSLGVDEKKIYTIIDC